MSEETIYEQNEPEQTPVTPKNQEDNVPKKEMKKAKEAKETSEKGKNETAGGGHKNVTVNIGKTTLASVAAALAGSWRRGSTAGIAGTASGIDNILAPFQSPDSESTEGADEAGETAEGSQDVEQVASESASVPSEELVGRDVPVATGVEDDMSFGQAFAAARSELGPGGVFTWHGQIYGTYYGNEWNAMTSEEREQYWVDVNHTVESMNEESADLNEEEELVDDSLALEEELEEEEGAVEESTDENEEELVEVELTDRIWKSPTKTYQRWRWSTSLSMKPNSQMMLWKMVWTTWSWSTNPLSKLN